MLDFDGQLESVIAPSRTSAIAEALRRAILSGALPAGSALVENDLARRFGTSKTPVREALKALVGQGLVTFSEYRGATVRLIDSRMVEDIFDLRYLLEPVAAERTVKNGVDGAALEDALEKGSTAEDRVNRSLANRHFHRILYSGHSNSILISTLDELRDQVALISVNAWSRDATWENEAAEHRAIFEAAVSGDAAKAGKLLRQHIRGFAARVLEQMEGSR